MDRRAGTSRWLAACLALAPAGLAVALGLPGQLVWGGSVMPGKAAGETEHRRAVHFARAPALAPIPLRYAPGWLPDGLHEGERFASVSGSPSTSVDRIWVPNGVRDLSPTSAVSEFGDRRPPYLSIEVEHSPGGPRLGWVLHDAVDEPGGYQGSNGYIGFTWEPEPDVRLTVGQRGLGLDRATMYRIARSMRPVDGEFTFPLQARELPVGLTETSWDSYVAAVVHPDHRSGGWSGTVSWCFALEVTVGGAPPGEAASGPWLLRLAGHPAWHGSRPLGEDRWRDFVVLQLRPGTMVTASTLRHGHRAPDYDILARIAAAVEVPG